MTLSAKNSLGLRFRVMSQNVNFFKFFILFQRSLDGEHPALHSVLTANFSPLMQKNPQVDEIERFFFMCIYTTSPLGGGSGRDGNKRLFTTRTTKKKPFLWFTEHMGVRGKEGEGLLWLDGTESGGEESFKHLYRQKHDRSDLLYLHTTQTFFLSPKKKK